MVYCNLELQLHKGKRQVSIRSKIRAQDHGERSTIIAFYIAEVGEPKKKRIKSDTDTARFSAASMRNQLDQAANLKGEQVSTSAVFRNISQSLYFMYSSVHAALMCQSFSLPCKKRQELSCILNQYCRILCTMLKVPILQLSSFKTLKKKSITRGHYSLRLCSKVPFFKPRSGWEFQRLPEFHTLTRHGEKLGSLKTSIMEAWLPQPCRSGV